MGRPGVPDMIELGAIPNYTQSAVSVCETSCNLRAVRVVLVQVYVKGSGIVQVSKRDSLPSAKLFFKSPEQSSSSGTSQAGKNESGLAHLAL